MAGASVQKVDNIEKKVLFELTTTELTLPDTAVGQRSEKDVSVKSCCKGNLIYHLNILQGEFKVFVNNDTFCGPIDARIYCVFNSLDSFILTVSFSPRVIGPCRGVLEIVCQHYNTGVEQRQEIALFGRGTQPRVGLPNIESSL